MAEKSRLELRLDADLHRDLKALADRAGISVNQLAAGVLRWAVDHGRAGDPAVCPSTGKVMGTDDEPGVVWFGDEPEDPRYPDQPPCDLVFSLDFTGRSSIRKIHDYIRPEDRA